MSTAPTRTDSPTAELPPEIGRRWPTQHDLPCEDDSLHDQFEMPQNMLLTSSIRPFLAVKHSDGRFCICHDCGTYWRLIDTPPYAIAVVPDWFYAADVKAYPEGARRSFVLWEEDARPSVILEYASGDGREELDATPLSGKFWIYERQLMPMIYGIYIPSRAELRVFRSIDGRFVEQRPNPAGRFAIPPLGVELGTWHGTVYGLTTTWMRWFGTDGILLPSSEERADAEKQRADALQAELERLRRQLTSPTSSDGG